jgi:mono/diheme cytochrome c family protein
MGKTAMLSVLLATLVLSGVAAGETASDQASGEQRSQEVPLVIPQEARLRKNPVPASSQAVENGRVLFSSQCVMCHGVRGDGKGDLAGRLTLAMPDFTDPSRQQARTDGDLFYILTQGHGAMPGQRERLPEMWKWELIHYIRSLAAARAE